MSNSSMVCYTKISPNRNSPRKDTIKKITIHHMAGNLSVETCGNVFAPSSRQASSNYGIGSDGRVGMYVEEKDRSWCSSNGTNDHQAITIEVANDGGAPNWHVSDKAIDSLIKLCIDICQRNGIKKLVYTGDSTGNVTLHRFFKNTNCPGPYLESKIPYVVDEVNKKLLNIDGISNFVERMYTVVLGRPSDKAGKDNWISAIVNGTPAATVAKGFIYSVEFQQKQRTMSNEVYVETLYKAFFNRPSDVGGKQYWCNQLAAGASRDSVIDGFLNSQEWINLCNKYNIKAK